MTISELQALGGDVSDSGNITIRLQEPYRVAVRITGDAPLLMHRYQADSVAAKTAAAKGSKAKKSDDVESYVWRDDNGIICLPGEYLRGSIVDPRNGSAKYLQDPRSPRKSALDLVRAGLVAMDDLAPIIRADGTPAETWDYLDRRRVVVQRAAVSRERPAWRTGWSVTHHFLVTSPEYIDLVMLRHLIMQAGRLVGVGNFRPTFGRFSVTAFDLLD